MKRVRYLAGATGLAPVAFGMVAIPAAAGAVTPPAGASHGKTVAVHRVRADAGCTGDHIHYMASTPDTNLYGHFWYTDNGTKTCIGTVVFSMAYTKTICKKGYVIEESPHTGGASESTGTYCGNKGYTYTWSFSVHKSINNTVSVCAGSTYAGGKMNCTQVP